MPFLYLLEKMRNPVTDFLFSIITHIGEEPLFLVIAIMFFWCINKREGYFILATGFIGTVANQWLKIVCKIERPWIKDPNFTIVESARAEATGYSFPSGHTQNIAGTFGVIGLTSKKRWAKILCVVLIVVVAFSRMYLGVHTPYDVAASIIIAALILFILAPVFQNEEKFNKFMPYITGFCALISLGLLIYVNLLSEEGVDIGNLENARKNAATLFACMLGLLVVYPLDRFVIKFKTCAKWYSNLIKSVLGFSVLLALKVGLKIPLERFVALFTDSYSNIARGIRYFIVVVFAGAVWPLTFNFFANLRISFIDRFTDRLKEKFSKIKHG